MRNSRVSSRAACLLALTLAGVSVAELSAHRRDEYLQAARLAIAPGSVHVDLDLTPGIALADAVIADIDRNGDGSLSPEEQIAYAGLVLGAIEVDVDARSLPVQLGDAKYPDVDAIRRGEGTIRLQLETTVQGLSNGAHQLVFRNRHRSDGVYLANALVPESDDVAVTRQQRDANQSELIINYVVRPPATRGHVWLLSGLIVSAALSVLLLRSSRSAR